MGLVGDPLGRNILGLPASAPAIVVVAEVVGIVEVTAGMGVKVVLPVVTVDASSGISNGTTWFCLFTEAKKCLADARASWLASLVLRILLGGSTCPILYSSEPLSGTVFTEV